MKYKKATNKKLQNIALGDIINTGIISLTMDTFF